MAATAETKLEQTVREEQEAHDAQQKKADEALFDKTQYDDPELQLAKVDEQSIDKIRLSFTGSVMLDRGNKADVALYRRLSLGKGDVTLQVEGRCSASGAKQNTNREGDLDVVVGEKTIKVETVYLSTADGVVSLRVADDEDGGEPLDDPAED
jgi:hypothetical protein